MKLKRNHVGIVLGALLALVAAELGLRVVDEGLPVGTDWPSIETDMKYHQLLGLPEADVVFLGSSITEAAVDPVEFAAISGTGTAFNSGIPFSTPFSNEFWLEQVVLPNVQPDLVIIGLTAWSGGGSRENDPLLLGLQAAMEAEGATSPFALIEYAGVLSEWNSRSANDRVRDFLTDLGHQTAYYERSIHDAAPLDLPFGPIDMPKEEIDAVQRMIDRLAVDDIEAMVYIEPGRYPGDNGTVDYDRYIDSILEHSDDWGVPVIDSFHQDWELSWFADLAHFNRQGTEAFTAYMARNVAKLTASR
ncbi:MAG: hypothetical protein ACRDX9_10035 [Acidimicrobiia bacterium]